MTLPKRREGHSPGRNVMTEQKSAGVHISGVTGAVSIAAGRDAVAGHKVTVTHTAFDDQTRKDEFLTQLDDLHSALYDLKLHVEAPAYLDVDARAHLVNEILEQVSELERAKQNAEQIAPGPAPRKDILHSLAQCLNKTDCLFDKIQAIGHSAAGVAEKLAPVLARAVSILASARNVLPMP